MSLASQITALAQAVGADIKALFSRALPSGGSVGQVLTKSSAADYAMVWAAAPGGGGGVQQVYVQPTAPVVTPGTTYIWVQTGLGADGTGFSIWIEDGL